MISVKTGKELRYTLLSSSLSLSFPYPLFPPPSLLLTLLVQILLTCSFQDMFCEATLGLALSSLRCPSLPAPSPLFAEFEEEHPCKGFLLEAFAQRPRIPKLHMFTEGPPPHPKRPADALLCECPYKSHSLEAAAGPTQLSYPTELRANCGDRAVTEVIESPQTP